MKLKSTIDADAYCKSGKNCFECKFHDCRYKLVTDFDRVILRETEEWRRSVRGTDKKYKPRLMLNREKVLQITKDKKIAYQKTVAGMAGLKASTFAGYMRGKCGISHEVAKRIADALGVTVGDIAEWREKEC